MKEKNESPFATNPDQFAPRTPADLIGSAARIGADLLKLARKIKPTESLKLLLFGPPGIGKSTIAGMIARELAAHPIDAEKVSGRNVSTDLVRDWQRSACYGSLLGGWKIKLIEEADLIPQVAQDLMLTLLDDLPPGQAVIGTSNLSLETLTERFQTRFRMVRVEPPGEIALAQWLVRHWRLPEKGAQFIALGACGNVRGALLDAADFYTFGKIEHRPKPPVVVKDPAASARALKAWETMRSRNAA